MSDSPLKVNLEQNGRLLRLTLSRPKANIVDAAMIATLQAAFDDHKDRADLAAVLITAEGPNFSFGASVEEHLPAQCESMLKELHRLIITVLEYRVPVMVCVRGACLGGGLEVACAGHLIFAAPEAVFGQPEIRIGVFAPAASCLLPERIGRQQAEDLLLSGRTIDAAEAARIGLILRVADDPEAEAMRYFEEQLAPLSSRTLHHATRAARCDFIARVKEKLVTMEELYLNELMSSHDAVEGLNAFIEKRPPKWVNR